MNIFQIPVNQDRTLYIYGIDPTTLEIEYREFSFGQLSPKINWFGQIDGEKFRFGGSSFLAVNLVERMINQWYENR